MPICVVVLSESVTANQLNENLREVETPLTKAQLVKPLTKPLTPNSLTKQIINEESWPISKGLQPIDIDSVQLLNPKLSRQRRAA